MKQLCHLIFVLFTYWLLLAKGAFAQVENVVLDRLTVEDGLSQASIYHMLQDNVGYIWLGTDTGLNFYDGYSIRTLPGPNGKFDISSVSDIKQDKSGIFWLSFYEEGLFRYDPKSDEYQHIASKDPQNEDYTVYISLPTQQPNQRWLITDKTLLLFDVVKKRLIKRVSLEQYLPNTEFIYKVVVYKNTLLIMTRKGLFVYDIASQILHQLPQINPEQLESGVQNFESHEANKVYDIAVINGRIFIGTNDGLFSIAQQSFDQYLQSPQQFGIHYRLDIAHAEVWKLAVYKNRLYVGDNRGLFVFDTAMQTSRFLFSYGDSYPNVGNVNVTSLMVDNSGLVWMGSIASGAFIWDPNTENVEVYTYNKLKANSLTANSISVVRQSKINPDHLWLGTDNGLNKVSLATGEVDRYLAATHAKSSHHIGNIYNIHQDKSGLLWLHTDVGLALFDPKQQQVITPDFPQATLDIRETESFVSTMIGNSYWMTTDAGLAKINVASGELTLFEHVAKQVPPSTVWGLFPSFSGAKHELLLTTHNTIWLFDESTGATEAIYKNNKQNLAEYTFVDSWVRDNSGDIWLAYSGVGIVHLDGKTYKEKATYSKVSHGIDLSVYSIIKDNSGDIWFSSHQGLYNFTPTSNKAVNFRLFTRSDGLLGNEFNANAGTVLTDGRLAFGGIAGLNIISPQEFNRRKLVDVADVKVSAISSLSRAIKTPTHIDNNHTVKLNYDDVGIRLDFSTFAYANSQKPLFEYEFINGLKFPLIKYHFIIFPKLESGLHTLRVRAKSPLTGEYSKPFILNFEVAYAPWASPSAKITYALIILIITFSWLYGRYRRQLQLKAAHEQTKYRENRLQLALVGSNSEVWDWKARDNAMYGKRIVNDLGFAEGELANHFDVHASLIHPEDRDEYLSRWQLFVTKADQNESFETTYRLKTKNGNWLWYKDLGKIVGVNNKGRPTRITGSYTNITESKATQERAQYYAAAFEQTKDWVLIVDESFEHMRANKAMLDVFGWQDGVIEFSSAKTGLSKERIKYYRKVFSEVKTTGHWRGDELFTTPQDEQYHVIVNISLSRTSDSDTRHFVCVFTDISAQKAAEHELRYMANYDHLTGLPNRTLLLDRISHAIESSNRHGNPIAVFFIDLDRFKQVNDSLGHDYGDLLLKEVTSRLSVALRKDDTVARIGGDEFVVVLEKFKSTNELGRIAQKIIFTLEQPITLNNNVVSIGASIGIAVYPEDAKSSENLLRNSDVAMYHAKQMGRNNFQFFTEHMNQAAKQRLVKESEIKLAVKNDDFFNLYQPIIDGSKGLAVGAELLMRWQHQSEVRSPVNFIPLAEDLGLIIGMTEVAMEKAFTQLNIWRQYRPDFYVSVNFSAAHFINDDLISWLSAMFNKHQLPPNALKVEVTESAFISEPEKAISTMHTLNKMGVRLALDDFGTGFSSLSYLKQLPLDIIKIDRSFVHGIGNDSTDQAIVDATLVLAKSLNMYCIAEGVETVEQLEYLVERDCRLIQGFLYYQPLPAELLTAKLLESAIELKAVTSIES